MVLTGAVAGAPSTQTVAVKLQDSDDGTSRGVLRSLLTTPITVTAHETAEGVVFDFRAQARLDGVFAGRLTVRKSNTT